LTCKKGFPNGNPFLFLRYVLAAAAAQDDNRDKDNDPAIIVAEERIKAAHCKASLH